MSGTKKSAKQSGATTTSSKNEALPYSSSTLWHSTKAQTWAPNCGLLVEYRDSASGSHAPKSQMPSISGNRFETRLRTWPVSCIARLRHGHLENAKFKHLRR